VKEVKERSTDRFAVFPRRLGGPFLYCLDVIYVPCPDVKEIEELKEVKEPRADRERLRRREAFPLLPLPPQLPLFPFQSFAVRRPGECATPGRESSEC